MITINIDTIKSNLEELKTQTSETKNKQNDAIKTKQNKKNIAEFVDSIELFLKTFKIVFFDQNQIKKYVY